MSPKQPKRITPPRVQIYFTGDRLKVYEDLQELSRITHRSASDIAYAFFIQLFHDEQMRDSILRGSGVTAVELKKSKKK